MMTEEDARALARGWVEAWNSHDLDRIMSHYAEDFAMTSPFIAALLQEPGGTIRGKAKVREYWSQALKKVPDLHFKLIDVLVGVDSITIYYQAIFGKRAAEVLFLDANHQVKRGIAHYVGG